MRVITNVTRSSYKDNYAPMENNNNNNNNNNQSPLDTDFEGQGMYKLKLIYSSVLNRLACTFIDFEKKFPPAQPYFGLHVY